MPLPIIFEAATPRRYTSNRPTQREDVQDVLNAIHSSISGKDVYGIGVPEVHDGDGYVSMPSLDYAKWVLDATKENIVLYRSPAYFPKDSEHQQGYIRKVLDSGIDHLVIAGGRTRHNLMGYSPLEFLRLVKQTFGDVISPGGITIFEREGEAQRLAEKTKEGMRYFRSQQIFDAGHAIRTLVDYDRECQTTGIKAGTIFMSFVPVFNENTIGKLRRLGVTVPEGAAEEIYCDADRKTMRRRSIEIAKRTALEILEFVDRRINVPLGLDIESFFAGHVSVAIAAELMYALDEASKGYSNSLLGTNQKV